MKNNFLNKAEKLSPVILKSRTQINGKDENLNKGDTTVYDFGNHYVGRLNISFASLSGHNDSPLYFYIRFCENERELNEDVDAYKGFISPSWIQQEHIHVDDLPSTVRFKRRYAFRYIILKIIETGGVSDLRIKKLIVTDETSADDAKIRNIELKPEDNRLDSVSIRTLRNCMQTVFEDGPKRDRRLWLGDLRLQALSNYYTFKNNDLVKRCLYLFAGCALKDGRVPSNVFINPKIQGAENSLFDYSLFFISTLWEYYQATDDKETLFELSPIAERQYECAKLQFENDILTEVPYFGWCFIDWSLKLNRQASAQAVYVYTLFDLIKIRNVVGLGTEDLVEEIDRKSKKARDKFFDTTSGLYVSGKDKQLSWATQIWFVLAKIITPQEAKNIFSIAEKRTDIIKPVTPYMMHYYIQALIDIGEKTKAYNLMHEYWDGMITQNADTFWELYNPHNPDESPYGGKAVNSYCHAWSCTPAYFLRKYFIKEEI